MRECLKKFVCNFDYIQEQWNKNLLNDLPLQKWFRNLWVKL